MSEQLTTNNKDEDQSLSVEELAAVAALVVGDLVTTTIIRNGVEIP